MSDDRPDAALESRVLEVVRALAAELHGPRAAHAARPGASLEREVGLGSLERVELLLRLERRFGCSLGDGCLALDSAADLTRAVAAAGPATPAAAAPASEAPAPGEAVELAPAATLHATLWRRAERHPQRPQVFLREDDGRELTVTYGLLLEEARRVAGGLREQGVRRGDRVALMLPTSLDFLRSFQGVLLAGAVPVPIYPPVRLDRIEEYALRQSAILANAGVVALITVGRARPVAALLQPAVRSLRSVVTAEELAALGAPWSAPEGQASDPAFIQYTSGSTGQPKGVLLTHANLLANVRAIAEGVGVRPDDVGVSWLPLYHDMGLIGAWLFCLVLGLPIDIQSPLSFLARPERWLWAVHRRRGTLSPAPNFAYELCVRRIADSALEGLDLGSWRCALNGAEPISPDTLERFVRRFGPLGFRREALLPVYGLAESSVALAFPPPGRGPRVDRVRRAPFEGERRAEPAPADDAGALRFVSVGRALPEHEIRLVDEQGQDVPERRLGRLIFRGPSATPGYFGQPEATAAITLPGGWLDSGDLAYAAEGELYIAGRLKDLIIKGGRNLVPQEIEELAAAVPGIRRGCVAAFGVTQETQGTEGLVIVAETRARDPAARERLQTQVVETVAANLGVPPDEVVLVPPGAVPKTSSGKIRRAGTKDLYLRGELGRASGAGVTGRLRLLAAATRAAAALLLRRLGRGLYAAWAALTFIPCLLVFWLLAALVPGRRASRAFARGGSWLALRLLGARFESRGLERLRQGGPWLLVSNHTSYADIPLLLALLPLDFVFVAKREAAHWPLIGFFIRRSGHLTVDRRDAQDSLAATERVVEALRAGRSVLVFPEATFRAASGLRPFRLGAFKTAAELGLPVLPLAISGARRFLRDPSWLPRPGRLRVWAGELLRAEGSDWRAIVALRDRTAAAIAAECGEPRLDLVAAGPDASEGL